MRTRYRIEGEDALVVSFSKKVAMSFKVPMGNYMKLIGGERSASRHSDGTAITMPGIFVDTRKIKTLI